MADPFQPKFVDLVRNYSTTVGTDDFVLGPAVNGYTSFTAACTVGDTFYYAAIGVDIPAEREVGRGTLLANGTIARAPVSGGKTSFSKGTKAIALIAAAEWFSTIGSLAASAAPFAVADRTALAAAARRGSGDARQLAESGREGIFVFDSADLSALVAADPNQGVYVAPASDLTGASGAWVRKHDGPMLARWFGTFDPAGSADNSAIVVAAINLANALRTVNVTGYGYATPTVELPLAANGINLGTTTLHLTNAVRLIGQGQGTFGGQGTLLKWSAGCTGISIDAQGCTLEKIGLQGGWVAGSTAEGEYHAIKALYKFTIRDLWISNWQGDGINAFVSAGGTGDGVTSAANGNVNGAYASMATIQNCRNGVMLRGADVNAGNFIGFDVNYCRQSNVLDRSFLGNTWTGLQTAGGGVSDIVAGVTPCCCYNNGHIFAVAPEQVAGASSNAPPSTASSNLYWTYWKDSSTPTSYAPQWATGITFRMGGAVTSDRLNGQGVYINIYAEIDQPPIQLGQNDYVVGCQGNIGSRTRIIRSTYRGTEFGGSALVVNGDVVMDTPGANAIFGPSTGAADGSSFFDTTNYSHFLYFRAWNAGSPTNYATIFGQKAFGLFYDVIGGFAHRFRVAGADVASVDANGLNLSPGKALSVNGATIIGSAGLLQAAAFPALAGDVTTAPGSLTTSIAANAVTFAKVQQVAASSLVGNPTGALANAQGITLGGGLTFSGTMLTLGALTPASVAATGTLAGSNLSGTNTGDETSTTILSKLSASNIATSGSILSSGTAGIGYAAGAGGTVTQTTSKATAVTLNKLAGAITLSAAALAANAVVSFTLTNSKIGPDDDVRVWVKGGNATAATYRSWAEGSGSGSRLILVQNISAGSLSEAVVLGFAVIKGAVA